jgi:phage gp46-like protein
MHLDPCVDKNVGGRRIFWTTRPEACGTDNLCGIECAIPGLEYKYDDSVIDGGRSIGNDEWLESLILNILNTRARTDIRCPAPPGVYGHWSESYRDDKLYIGSTLWNAAEKPYMRNADAVRAVATAVRSDVGKLIVLGIATTVEVEATYRGNNSVAVTIKIVTTTGTSHLNLSGSFVTETWVWH